MSPPSPGAEAPAEDTPPPALPLFPDPVRRPDPELFFQQQPQPTQLLSAQAMVGSPAVRVTP